mgnify:FL=1
MKKEISHNKSYIVEILVKFNKKSSKKMKDFSFNISEMISTVHRNGHILLYPFHFLRVCR